jgi:hypothetical protein
MANPKIYADFHNSDSQGRLRLNCIGTLEDLAEQHLELRDGLLLTLYSDDLDAIGQLDELVVDGVVSFSQDELCWVAGIDWAAIRNVSNKKESPFRHNSLPSPLSAKESARTKG